MTTAAAEIFDPQLLQTLRAAPWRSIEKRFLFILAASMALHIVFATYVASQPMPIATDVPLDELQDRFSQRVTLPPLLPIPRVLPPVAAAPRAAPAPRVNTQPVPKGQAANVALVKVIGSVGPGGAFGELLNAPTLEIAEALRDAKGVLQVDTAPNGPKGPATGQVATIETIGTGGTKTVTLAARTDKAPVTSTTGPIDVDPGEIDPKVLQQFITARRAAIQSCYERELHHNPGMKGGKITLRLMIGTAGRVSSLAVEEDGLGSEAVGSCMATLMKRWIFPVTPKDEFPVSVPFIFARAN